MYLLSRTIPIEQFSSAQIACHEWAASSQPPSLGETNLPQQTWCPCGSDPQASPACAQNIKKRATRTKQGCHNRELRQRQQPALTPRASQQRRAKPPRLWTLRTHDTSTRFSATIRFIFVGFHVFAKQKGDRIFHAIQRYSREKKKKRATMATPHFSSRPHSQPGR